MENDTTENARRELLGDDQRRAEGESGAGSSSMVRCGTPTELGQDFEVSGFLAPLWGSEGKVTACGAVSCFSTGRAFTSASCPNDELTGRGRIEQGPGLLKRQRGLWT